MTSVVVDKSPFIYSDTLFLQYSSSKVVSVNNTRLKITWVDTKP